MEAFTETGRAIFGKPPPCTKLYHGCMAYILENMARDGCYGDHLTLQAAAELFNVEFIAISSLGPAATTDISPVDSLPVYSFHISHFAEGDGEHYVGLQNVRIIPRCVMLQLAFNLCKPPSFVFLMVDVI